MITFLGCGRPDIGGSPQVLSAAVDTTGLLLTITLSKTASYLGRIQWPDGSYLQWPDSEYAQWPLGSGVSITVDGVAATLTYVSGSGTNTWVYGITSGNPSGNPVLAGAAVLLSVAYGVWQRGWVRNAAIVGQTVTNNSTVLVPAGISGLQLWLKADGTLWQLSTLSTPAVADNDPVGAWVSGDPVANNVTQATSGFRPLYKTGIQNSLPAVLFDGADDVLSNLVGNWYATGFTAFIVAKNVSTVGSQVYLGSPSNNMLGCAQASNELHYFKQGVAGFKPLPSLAPGTTTKILCYQSPALSGGAATMLASLNGGADSSISVTGISDATGMAAGGKDPLNGYLMEICLYSGVLSAGAIAAVKSYLNTKWVVY